MFTPQRYHQMRPFVAGGLGYGQGDSFVPGGVPVREGSNIQGFGAVRDGSYIPGGVPVQGGSFIPGGVPAQGGGNFQGGIYITGGVPVQGGIYIPGGIPVQEGSNIQGIGPVQGGIYIPSQNGFAGFPPGYVPGSNYAPGYDYSRGYGYPLGYVSPVPDQRIVYVPYAAPPPIYVERLAKALPMLRPPSMRQLLGDARMYEYPEQPLRTYTTRGPRDFLAPNPPGIGY
jgi:hypothetical protein